MERGRARGRACQRRCSAFPISPIWTPAARNLFYRKSLAPSVMPVVTSLAAPSSAAQMCSGGRPG
eukprot:131477-Lingulodinium_polyedra.AAC.1